MNGMFKIVMAIAAIFLVFVISTERERYSIRFRPISSVQAAATIFNVKEFGAKGDGVSDDTGAIQATINAAPDGSTISFPQGTYNVANFLVKNRSGLSFVGEERKSLIRQKSGAARMATFDGARDIVISKLAFDANGINSYGGVVFYATNGVRIENNSFMDSASKPIQATDRYPVVFGKGASPSQDIRILNNTIDDLQLEVDHARKVLIEGNSVSRAVKTAGIGIFSIGDNAVAEDYLITRNKVIDPIGAGFSIGLDPPTTKYCIFRRITIANNQLIRTKTSSYGIRIGTPDSSQKTTGNLFEDITIKDNDLRSGQTAPSPERFIFANSSPAAAVVFQRLLVTGNTIDNQGSQGGRSAIDLRRIQNSTVADNKIRGVANGISLGGDLLSNQIRNNEVEASDVAYALEGSLGGNKVSNNRVVGNPRQSWRLSALQTSDSVQQ